MPQNGKTRIFFATDVHGSEQVWRKWINTYEYYKADILMLCGDLTGKVIVPLILQGDGTVYCHVFGRDFHFPNDKEKIREMEKKVRFSGYYPYVCGEEEVEKLQHDPRRQDELFDELMVKELERWLTILEEKLPKEVKVYVSPGNDDRFVIDPIIKNSERVEYPIGKVCNPCYDYEMITCEWSNPTPWDSPRECSEKMLREKLEEEFRRANGSERLICNFHCPPYNTRLDICAKIGKDLKPVAIFGKKQLIHAGSKAVREFIEEHQPLLGLHGHIHESYASEKIGRTLCINPGSEYTEGILRGYIIDLSRRGIEATWKVEG